LKNSNYTDLGFAKIDFDRKKRRKQPEVIFAQSKEDEHLCRIFRLFCERKENILATRMRKHQYEFLKDEIDNIIYDELSMTARVEFEETEKIGNIAICCGGTSDIRVCEEARITAEFFGANVTTFYDIGVSASLGLSLGEYTALCAADVFSLDEGIDLVKNRGLIMGQGAGGKGSMVAVMKTGLYTIQDLVDQAKEDDVLAVCNLNSPGQIVVGGEFAALDRFEEKCKEAKIKRYMRLNVEGPFHTQILNQAAQDFADNYLSKVDFKEPSMDVYTNLSGKNYRQVDSIVDNLKDQMCSPVRFIDCVENMIADGCQLFIEIGPGKSLSGFVKKINKDVRVVNIQNISDIEGIDLEDLK